MQYYTFELDNESSELCTIVTSFGLYKYRKMPMGINQAPDIAQEMMERTLKNIANHLIVIEKVCKRLENKEFSSHHHKRVGVMSWVTYGHVPKETSVCP